MTQAGSVKDGSAVFRSLNPNHSSPSAGFDLTGASFELTKSIRKRQRTTVQQSLIHLELHRQTAGVCPRTFPVCRYFIWGKVKNICSLFITAAICGPEGLWPDPLSPLYAYKHVTHPHIHLDSPSPREQRWHITALFVTVIFCFFFPA